MVDTIAPSVAPRLLDTLSTQFKATPEALTDGQRTEFQALLREKDPELLHSGLSSLAARLEKTGKAESAAQIYSAVLEALPQEADAELRARLQKRLGGIQGQGDIGARAEFLLARFAEDSFDPKVIGPMMLGTSVFTLTRSLALGRFGNSALFRAIGPRFAASSLGFAAEVPAFALSARALRPASKQEPSIGQELGGAAITLGFLKTFGHGAQVLGSTSGLRSSSRFQQNLFSQAAMFGGLMTAHLVEERLGLRPHVDGATTVTDTLASMFSLGIGASLAHRALGRRYGEFHGELNWRFKNHGPRIKLGMDSSFNPQRMVMAEAGAVSKAGKETGLGIPWIHLSTGGGSGGHKKAKVTSLSRRRQQDKLKVDKLLEELEKAPSPTAEMILRTKLSIERLASNLDNDRHEWLSRDTSLNKFIWELPSSEIDKLMKFAQSEDSWLSATIVLEIVVETTSDSKIRAKVNKFLSWKVAEFAEKRARKILKSKGPSLVLSEIQQAIQEGKTEKAILVAREAFSQTLLDVLNGGSATKDQRDLLQGLLNLPHARVRSQIHDSLEEFSMYLAVAESSKDESISLLKALIRESPDREKLLIEKDLLSDDPMQIYFAKKMSWRMADLAKLLSRKGNPWEE